jgi:hypothetical protein
MKFLIEKNEWQIEQIEKVLREETTNSNKLLVLSITKETQPYNGT